MRPVLGVCAAALLAGCGGDRLPDAGLPDAPSTLRLSSPAFADGSTLPRRYTCDGAGDEPAMRAGTVPPGAHELVLVVADPDAPGGTFVHLTRFGLEPGGGSVDRGGREGANSAGHDGWTPPCPPQGDGTHRYVWTVYALRRPTGLQRGAAPADVVGAVRDGVLARGTLTARYARR